MKLGQFELVQLLEGARCLYGLNRDEQNLVFKIIDTLAKHDEVFELNSNEVRNAYDFICFRLSHCEMERDCKSPRFNPRTYEYLKVFQAALFHIISMK